MSCLSKGQLQCNIDKEDLVKVDKSLTLYGIFVDYGFMDLTLWIFSHRVTIYLSKLNKIAYVLLL